MSWHNPKTSRETRIEWLRQHRELWESLDLDDYFLLKPLAETMKKAGLYSVKTNVPDIAMRLRDLLIEAKKK